MKLTVPLTSLLMCACATLVRAQDNYEIQVYESGTVDAGATMVELHSNFTFQGSDEIAAGTQSTNSALHETLEVTHGITPWFEIGGYLFTSSRRGSGWQWVGSHIRPRVAVPPEWKWPVGAGLSVEAGYQRRVYSADTWTVEIRPIIDRQIGPWYVALNPVVERSLDGADAGGGFGFSPNAKISLAVESAIAVGLEYYGSIGPIADPDPVREQQHQIVPAVDLYVSPEWEVNFGVCLD